MLISGWTLFLREVLFLTSFKGLDQAHPAYAGQPTLCKVTWLLLSTTCARHLHSDNYTKELVDAAQPRHSGIWEELSIWSSVWGMEKSGGDGKAVGRRVLAEESRTWARGGCKCPELLSAEAAMPTGSSPGFQGLPVLLGKASTCHPGGALRGCG